MNSGAQVMWNNVLTLVVAVLGMALLLGLWYAIQMYLRFKGGCGKDRDLLEFMAHGCAGCKGPGTCHLPDRTESEEAASKEEHHHELV